MHCELLGLVKCAARLRDDPPVADEFILRAHTMIERGEVVASTYPSGIASLRDIYRLALMLQTEDMVKNTPTCVQ